MARAQIKDEHGNIYPSLSRALFETCGNDASGCQYDRLRKHGFLNCKGHRFEFADPRVAKAKRMEAGIVGSAVNDTDALLVARLKKRYSDAELDQIARGEGIERTRTPFPEIRLTGEHHRILVMSDTHIGSSYSPEEWHDIVSSFANDPENGIECILHCGDLVEGMKIGRVGTQIYELSDLGFEAQRDKAIEMFSKYNRPMYVISGNHDMFFKEYAGADIVKAIAEQVPMMTYVGYDTADVTVGGCIVRLHHGGDGNSYALSYRLQKIVEAITGGHKPNILLAGHVHKYCSIFERNIHAVSVPCMQAQTAWMRGKKIAAHTGFLVLDFDTISGQVRNFGVKFYPFYA